jgi:hypothetical protein
VELPADALRVSHDGREATLEAKHVCVVDSFQFGGTTVVPATVSFTIKWEAIGPFERRGSGTDVPATDPAAFVGRFATARSTASFSGSQLGFSFRSTSAVADGRLDGMGWAEMGTERNGSFLG